MEIRDKDYSVTWDERSGRLTLTGTLRLMTRDYKAIGDLLDSVQRQSALPRLLIDVRGLLMINSSGLNTLSRFVLGLRGRPGTEVVFHGSRSIVWQTKTLANMKSFLPTARIELY